MDATTYGQRGGIGPTGGRKLETIASSCGHYRKRVYNGQRWLMVSQKDELGTVHIDAHQTKESAERASEYCYRQGFMVHFVVPAEPITENK